MTEIFIPNLIVESVYEITPDFLKSRGIKGVMTDLDNTLAERKVKEPEEKIIAWINLLICNDIKVGIISNNNQKRVNNFNKKLGLKHNIANAKKPFVKSFLALAKKMELEASEITVVGDLIYTDVLGANLAGMFSILVTPNIANKSLLYKIRHLFEKPFINIYKKKSKI